MFICIVSFLSPVNIDVVLLLFLSQSCKFFVFKFFPLIREVVISLFYRLCCHVDSILLIFHLIEAAVTYFSQGCCNGFLK